MINDRLVWYLEKHKLIVNVKVASAKTEVLLINWCDFPYRNNMYRSHSVFSTQQHIAYMLSALCAITCLSVRHTG